MRAFSRCSAIGRCTPKVWSRKSRRGSRGWEGSRIAACPRHRLLSRRFDSPCEDSWNVKRWSEKGVARTDLSDRGPPLYFVVDSVFAVRFTAPGRNPSSSEVLDQTGTENSRQDRPLRFVRLRLKTVHLKCIHIFFIDFWEYWMTLEILATTEQLF